MQFSDTSTLQGIIQEITFFTNADTTSYATNDRVRNVNRWLDVIIGDILSCDGRWQWDDSNLTTLPIATTNLVSGQDDYSFDSTLLQVEKIECLDSGGNIWSELRPFDVQDLNGQSYSEFYKTDGQPSFYDIVGNSIILKPASNYNSTNGLKVYFKRTPDYFTSSDTTQEPGIPKIYHRLLSLGASYDWAIAKGMANANVLKQELEQLRQKNKEFITGKIKSEVSAISPRNKRYK